MNAAAAAASHAAWTTASGERTRAIFAVEGIRCSACARTIERAVNAVDGVERASVNGATARVAVDWNPRTTSLTAILGAVSKAGFRPVPLAGEAAEQSWKLERRTALKRIGLAGLGMMQTMMFVVGLYTSRRSGIDPTIAEFLKLVSLGVVTPVILYSGAPFFRGAWSGLRNRTLGMDVPVALALTLAYVASAWNTFRGSGETYFDSISMFIFLLLVGRFIEMTVRQRNLSSSEALARSLPATALRIAADGVSERIPVAAIAVGDRLSIPRGAVIPVDARLESLSALLDESLVTGEATPLERHAGDALLGGSVNTGQPLQVTARTDVADSALASIVALLERAQAERPRVARLADRAASWFIVAILVIAATTALVWFRIDPSRVFPAVLAVLVVTCPCALSLATPVAVAATTTRLARLGVLVTRADAIERLGQADTVMLDKTGTLTLGRLRVARTRIVDRAFDEAAVLGIAAALGRESTHPVGGAFAAFACSGIVAQDVHEHPGLGLEGTVDGRRWRLGRQEFVAGHAVPGGAPVESAAVHLALVPTRIAPAVLVAAFEVNDELRPEARAAIDGFRRLGLEVVIASGDKPDAVATVARTLGIERSFSGLRPEQKIGVVRRLQAEGHRVLMIGDGINDGPVLAAADVSCAMGQGSAIAQVAADLLLLNESLQSVADAVAASRSGLRVIRENLGWALAYNLAAVPLAAMGWVLPWVAALGMSLSSLGVVLNARRVANGRAAVPGARTATPPRDPREAFV